MNGNGKTGVAALGGGIPRWAVVGLLALLAWLGNNFGVSALKKLDDLTEIVTRVDKGLAVSNQQIIDLDRRVGVIERARIP